MSRADDQHEETIRDVRAALADHDFVPVRLGRERGLACEEIRGAAKEFLHGTAAGRFVAENVYLCNNLFGAELRTQFLIYQAGWAGPLAVFVRHQQVTGTADQKLPFLFQSIDESLPCPALVVLDGPELLRNAVMRVGLNWVRRSGGRVRCVFRGAYAFRRWVADGADYLPPPDPELPGTVEAG